MDLELFHQEINDFLEGSKLRSSEAEELISKLKDENMEILKCKLDRKTVVITTWCRSQTAVECIQRLFEANRLKGSDFTDTRPCASKSLHSKLIIFADNHFNKTVVVCQIYVESTDTFRVEGTEDVYGVTKLRNKIYIICQTSFLSLIRVYEDRNPFQLQMEIETEIKYPVDIVSSEKKNCLYVSDSGKSCIWKITREREDQCKVIKWLKTKFKPSNLSVSCDGQLLVVNASSSILRIYGSDAEFIRSIRMPRDVVELKYAEQTSTGNFIILHQWTESEEERGSWRMSVMKWVVSELSKDGQTVIRRFVPSNESQMLDYPRNLAFDGDNQVFVADSGNIRVIVLDSDLNWNGVLCSATKGGIRWSHSLCYDKDKKQLIVVGADYYAGCIANVYTLGRR